MRLHSLLFVSLVVPPACAQNWCPPGAQWTYTNDPVSGESPGYRSVTYVDDTVEFGHPCKRLIYDQYWIIGGEIQHMTAFVFCTYEADGVIYFNSSVGLPLDTLYWMGANVGDHWHLAGFSDTDPCNRMIVTATGVTQVNDQLLPYLDYELDSMGVMVQRRIVERLGDLYDFWTWPQCEFGSSVIKGLRCYQDDEFGFYSTGIAPTCDYTNGVQEPLWGEVVAIVPNPGTDHFTLSLPPGRHMITLFDATGRVALQQRAGEGPAMVDTADLPAGVYVVHVDKGVRPVRWVKK